MSAKLYTFKDGNGNTIERRRYPGGAWAQTHAWILWLTLGGVITVIVRGVVVLVVK